MASGLDCIQSHAASRTNKDAVSKRKRVNRSAKLKQLNLEARRREQWLANQGDKQEEKSLHADEDPCANDPGEVLHPGFAAREALCPRSSRVSWASLLNSRVTRETRNCQITRSTDGVLTTQAQPDPELVCANSNSHTCFCIKRLELSPSPRTTTYAFHKGVDTDVSLKSCGDTSPKGKASKIAKGSSRSRSDQCNSKENKRIVADQKKENRGQEKNSDGTQPFTRLQDRLDCYKRETEDGWEAAMDAPGLLPVPKKSSSGILQVKAKPNNDQKHARTKPSSLLSAKPAKQPGSQHSTRQRDWMQNNLHQPRSLSSVNKHRGLCVSTNLNDPLDKPQCPICTEDLDSTDTSFDSCPCGFNICLFCYHKIASENGRCPGCRGVYIIDVCGKPAVPLPR